MTKPRIRPDVIAESLSVVIPAYNEADLLRRNIETVLRALEKFCGDFEIIISDDGSTDDTARIAAELARENPRVIAVENYPHSGKGRALRAGSTASKKELVGFLDADLEMDAGQFLTLYGIMKSENADVVIGSKRHPKSEVDYPAGRRVLSRVYYAIVRLLFGLKLTDSQTGIKLFRGDVLRKAVSYLVVKRFAFDVELLLNLQHRGARIAEAPVSLQFSRIGSRIGIGECVSTLLDTLALCYRLHVLKFYDRRIPKVERRPLISIIVPAKSVNEQVCLCVRGCLNLDYEKMEIIISPDRPLSESERDRLAAICKAADRCLSEGDETDERHPLRILPSPEGPARKRDFAAAAARGEMLAFIDSDVCPPPDWLNNAAAAFTSEKIAAVGGPNTAMPDSSVMERCGNAVMVSLMGGGFNNFRYIPKRHREVDDIPTCNLIIRKEDFDAVGGFDCDYWPGEDTIICKKLTRERKKTIAYDPDIIVFHRRRPLFRKHLEQVAGYATHRGYFAKRFPETSLRLRYFLPSLFCLYLCLVWTGGVFYTPLFYVYSTTLGLYAAAAFVTGIINTGVRNSPRVALGIFLTHIVYGSFFIRGLLARRLKEER